jgi:hypothetical protein
VTLLGASNSLLCDDLCDVYKVVITLYLIHVTHEDEFEVLADDGLCQPAVYRDNFVVFEC